MNASGGFSHLTFALCANRAFRGCARVAHTRRGLAMGFGMGRGVRHRFRTAALIVVSILWLRPALAQETVNYGSLSGRVVDPQGAVVPGARVSARQTDTNIVGESITDEGGRFRFPYLKVGPYELIVHLDGFTDARRDGHPHRWVRIRCLHRAVDRVLRCKRHGGRAGAAPRDGAEPGGLDRHAGRGAAVSRSMAGIFSTSRCWCPVFRRPTSAAHSCSRRHPPFPGRACRLAASAIFPTASSSTDCRRTMMPPG